MPIERAQAQGCDGNITICHVLQKKAILHLKWPKVEYSFSLTVHSLQKISGRFADFLYKTAFLKSKFEDDSVRVHRHNVHCKYFYCIQYSLKQCYVSHCSLAVHKAADGCTQPMTVLNLESSHKKQLLGHFIVTCTNIRLYKLLSMTVAYTAFSTNINRHKLEWLVGNFFYFTAF